LKVDHKNAYFTALDTVGLPRKFGRRDFRAAFASAVGPHDHFGARLAMGHFSGVPEAYQNWDDERKAKVALAAWSVFGTDKNREKVYKLEVKPGYFRRRVKNNANLKTPRIA
jgi:hypothetical protein